MLLQRAVLFWLWLLPSPVLLAAVQPSLTVYGEAPKYPAGFQHFDYVNPDAPKGGSLRRSSLESGPFDHLIPYTDKGTGVADIDGWLYAPLAYRSKDEPYTVYGLVAEGLELAADRSWLRFYLNPRARFDDGSPITAQDVRYTFELLMTQGSFKYRQQFADVAEVQVESPTQVRFVFKNSESRTLPLDLASLPVLPEHWWSGRNFADGGGFEAPLGSGPYRVSAVDAGRSVDFERVKDWWGQDLPAVRGRYNFDRLRVEFFADTDVSRQILKAGGYDYNREFSATGYTIGYAGAALEQGRLVREHLAPGSALGAQGFIFNLQKPQFQDRRVRQAIAMLWDFEWSNRQMMRSLYLRQQSFFSHSELAAAALPDAEELKILEPWRGQVPEEVFSQVFQAPRTDGSGIIRPQQLQALKLLEAAGWTPRGDQLVNAAGEPLHFTFLNDQKGLERLLLPFKRNLAQIGIGFDIRQVDTAQYTNRVRSRDYDMIIAAYPVSQAPGREMFNYFGSVSADDPGSNNYMALRDPAVDGLLNALVQADSRASMLAHARALDRVLQWGYYWIPNYYPPGISSVWWNRFGRPAIAPLYDAGLDTWWEVSPQALTLSQMRQRSGEVVHAGL
ncbi:extracellular solute-binding protein [Pseudomonas chlororaphis]|uniref:extracellular solute-binding protein n=2 Tax=Pseudomonas chlororaphis TaxID=587753 RepID=UPI0007B31F1A|nr:extracellular solute-binding protein [Pseudomonas chlororaphis]AZC51445.1 ABC transporter, periplasmic substrate-binding protein yejA [Pseudomonas chlororaphis subsp. piscium]AZC58016.1 ABC transporter, periplasmic substrate-binding protein yejA [Pseudomonas chlororaphis subsp. piscium]AZC64255.1 ABC transporter, periplasmic substrate-binding protein yejA [Pseudomonas chlororaphis subsp. piscium]AZC70476.1 ABC transporter, periplasmic substrate-binding protein yejA [Pseudomonas chlororaphis 